MLVYRISQTQFAKDITGEGASLFGGRWNQPMVSCLYTSESRALALLEYSVNVNIYEIKRALSFITYEIDDKKIHNVEIAELPGNWKDAILPKQTQEFGTTLLIEQKIPIIKIPSVVISAEFNYLINPLYYPNLKIVEISDYAYDIRVKSK